MALRELIAEQINLYGPISFHDFMELSLYHPKGGYYSSSAEKIGKGGDFYTTPWLTSIFGEMLALQMEEMWQTLGHRPFTIVEYGAGTGVLCRDILNRLKENDDLYKNLRYYIIEKSETMRQKERGILGDKVTWVKSIREIGSFEGCVLSNELLDNFSVHQVIMQDELKEVFVGFENGEFIECLCPASDLLKNYLKQLNITLPAGYRTEINLEALDWMREISLALDRGFVLTIDYGYPSSELYGNTRKDGTLVCYHKHRINYSPFENIGEQDITAHVNFSALRYWGESVGLGYGGFTNQGRFLQGLGLAGQLRRMEERGDMNHWTPQQKISILPKLLMEMGNKFKVLLQHKSVLQRTEASVDVTFPFFLSGFQFGLKLF